MNICIAFVGSAGIPNRYGGFESFAEHCGTIISKQVNRVIVTCDASLYSEKEKEFKGMERIFIPIRANGGMSIFHDLIAFLTIFRNVSHIVVLGVSGGIWFPLFRCLCFLGGKKLIVNVDGVEWRRDKFGRFKRFVLRIFDYLAQRCAHIVVYDNPALRPYILPQALSKSVYIAYSGDHVLRLPDVSREEGTALTICRIEPENNLEVLIEGVLLSPLKRYIIVGNWNNSLYGQALRQKYAHQSKLVLMDPIYDPHKLAELRESCDVYLHGHSVGGTNPSLVEMLFYDARLLCFDVPFNRETAGRCAEYFRNAQELTRLLEHSSRTDDQAEREERRALFSSQYIAKQYINLFT